MTQQGPDRTADSFQRDLNPHNRAGESDLPGPTATRTAYDIKDLHDRLCQVPDDILKQIPILDPGARLQEGAVYFDLSRPEAGEFKGMNNIVVGTGEWIVPKEEVDYELWNWLIGVDDPYRLGRFATAPPLSDAGGARG